MDKGTGDLDEGAVGDGLAGAEHGLGGEDAGGEFLWS